MSRTKDERFIMKLYELSLESKEEEPVFDAYQIGMMIGIAPKGVDNIMKLLAQANFIKKQSNNDITITKQGRQLVSSL